MSRNWTASPRCCCFIWLAGMTCLLLPGCMVPAARFAACRAHYRTLCERNQTLEAELARLDTHSRDVAQQLRQAEEELATLDQHGRANRRRLANFQNERDQLYRQIGAGGIPLIVSDQLAELAHRYPSLNFDAESGVAKLDTDVLFDTGQAELRTDAQELLGEFASILRSSEAGALRLMVVGHTDDQRITGEQQRDLYPNNWHLGAARSLVVADFLRVRGVREDRMGVASYGMYQPVAANRSDENRQRNRRVEIFLIAPDVPVVGWTETFTSVYR